MKSKLFWVIFEHVRPWEKVLKLFKRYLLVSPTLYRIDSGALTIFFFAGTTERSGEKFWPIWLGWSLQSLQAQVPLIELSKFFCVRMFWIARVCICSRVRFESPLSKTRQTLQQRSLKQQHGDSMALSRRKCRRWLLLFLLQFRLLLSLIGERSLMFSWCGNKTLSVRLYLRPSVLSTSSDLSQFAAIEGWRKSSFEGDTRSRVVWLFKFGAASFWENVLPLVKSCL